MKKYSLVATVALVVVLLGDVLAAWYFSNREIVNPTQQFTLLMNLIGIVAAVVKFASVATLLAAGAIWLKRSVQSDRSILHRH